MKKALAILIVLIVPFVLFADFVGAQVGVDFSYIETKIKERDYTRGYHEEDWLSLPLSLSVEFGNVNSGLGVGFEGMFEKYLFGARDGEDYDYRSQRPVFSSVTVYCLDFERASKYAYFVFGAGLSWRRRTIEQTASSHDASMIGIVAKMEYASTINYPVVLKAGVRIGTPAITVTDEIDRYRNITEEGFSIQAYFAIGFGDR